MSFVRAWWHRCTPLPNEITTFNCQMGAKMGEAFRPGDPPKSIKIKTWARMVENGAHGQEPWFNSTQDWHLGCIWFVEMKKTWSAKAWAILMELQFFWQFKSTRENPELLITFFDSVLWQAWNQLGCTCFFVVAPTVFLDFPVGGAFWQS